MKEVKVNLFLENQADKIAIAPNSYLLTSFALHMQDVILKDMNAVIKQAPLRHMVTKTGYSLSAAMTNCGGLGWVSDKLGYRYTPLDPQSHKPWPLMPSSFKQLAYLAASEAGFADFQPDACLINQYAVGASMGLHQDKDELQLNQPIVSVSLGIPAIFQFGGLKRTEKTLKIPLKHGDVVVWGGQSRLNFHAITKLKMQMHPQFGAYRYNLTFRKAG